MLSSFRVKILSSEVPVVVHGGEGLDSTLIAVSLAQVLLDPDARTIRG